MGVPLLSFPGVPPVLPDEFPGVLPPPGVLLSGLPPEPGVSFPGVLFPGALLSGPGVPPGVAGLLPELVGAACNAPPPTS